MMLSLAEAMIYAGVAALMAAAFLSAFYWAITGRVPWLSVGLFVTAGLASFEGAFGWTVYVMARDLPTSWVGLLGG